MQTTQPPISLDEESDWITVRAGDWSIEINLTDVLDDLAKIDRRVEPHGGPEWSDAIATLLVRLGAPRASRGQAQRFYGDVSSLWNELKKKRETTPDSPTGTESIRAPLGP